MHPTTALLTTHDSIYSRLIYSRLSLSRVRLSRIIAYFEMKILSLFQHGNLTTGNEILWIRGEIAHDEQFLLFSKIFSVYLSLQESNYILDM